MGDARQINGEQGRIDGAERFKIGLAISHYLTWTLRASTGSLQAVSVAIHFAADINPTYTGFSDSAQRAYQ